MKQRSLRWFYRLSLLDHQHPFRLVPYPLQTSPNSLCYTNLYLLLCLLYLHHPPSRCVLSISPFLLPSLSLYLSFSTPLSFSLSLFFYLSCLSLYLIFYSPIFPSVFFLLLSLCLCLPFSHLLSISRFLLSLSLYLFPHENDTSDTRHSSISVVRTVTFYRFC